MLLVKANPELKNTFKRLIRTMKLPVEWTEVFVVTNDILILAGSVRSLIFNFDNRRIYTSILEIPPESSRLESMPSDNLFNNVMNITLYTFGKWGSISGLKVDKDYQALNALFSQILKPVSVETDFNENNFRFFKNDIQITYEDMMLSVLRLLNSEGKLNDSQSLVTHENYDDKTDSSSEKPDSSDNEADSSPDKDDDNYAIGLWHNLRWKKDECSFEKAPKTEADSARSRIGNNFYITNYVCPECGQKLYMGVYPEKNELLIDTDEGRVFMARSYSCHNCNSFYTPRPKKLLQEGEVYSLKFDEDTTAYEDYLDILGSRAERTTNPNFNEFEKDYGKSEADPDSALQNTSDRQDSSAEATGNQNSDKNINIDTDTDIDTNTTNDTNTEIYTNTNIDTDTDIYTDINTNTDIDTAASSKLDLLKEKFGKSDDKPFVKKRSLIDAEVLERQASGSRPDSEAPSVPDMMSRQTANDRSQAVQQPPQILIKQLSGKTTDELKAILADKSRPDADPQYTEAVKEILSQKLTAKYEARLSILNNLSPGQLADLKKQINKETMLSDDKKTAYISEIDNFLYKAERTALAQKIELSQNKSYAEVEQIIKEIEKKDIPEELKQETLVRLKLIKSDRAAKEVERLVTHMPLHMDRKQLSAWLEKLDQYKEADLTPYRTQIEQKIDMAEKEEISAMVKRGGRKDRNSWWKLYEELQAGDYKEENKAPFLEKIYDKIRKLDEDEIERICPSIVTLSFAEGLNAYERINNGVFLPELKVNTLEMIKRRLTKLKTDESVLLMRKIKNETDEKMSEHECFYFYNAREELKLSQGSKYSSRSQEHENNDTDEQSDRDDRAAMLNAINGYGSSRGEFEYPLMVCDTSRAKNGKEGFVLTPDNIFYHTILRSGTINIWDIESVSFEKHLFSKGIFVKCWGRKKEKLPNSVKPEEREIFAKILDDFTTYLQERPESRSIEYMAKETHPVIHCYRCGYVYKGGNVCPKCGSKTNR